MIQDQKSTRMFVWKPHGLQVADSMAKRERFTAAYYIQNILTEIVARVERGERKLAVLADNARPYTAKVTKAVATAISCEMHDIRRTCCTCSTHCTRQIRRT
jgi:hypothetical protein